MSDDVKSAAQALRVAVYLYTSAAERYEAGDAATKREHLVDCRTDVIRAMEAVTERVAAVTKKRLDGLTPEAVRDVISKLHRRVSLYENQLLLIADGDESDGRQELALEWRDKVDKALEEADELRARMAQAREDRDADEAFEVKQ